MRTIVLFAFCVIAGLILIPIIVICFLIRWAYPLIPFGKGAIRIGQNILGMRLDVSGLEHVDKKASYVFMSNHLSAIDGPLLFMLIPQAIRVILKKESFRIPVVGQGMRLVGFVPVDRKGIRGGKRSIDRAVRMIREKRHSFLIFPEGTRSRDGMLQPFKRGGFFLALDSQVPVAPVSIQGTFELMPKGAFFIRKGEVKVRFHPPIPVRGFDRDSLPQLIDKVRKVILSGLDERQHEEAR